MRWTRRLTGIVAALWASAAAAQSDQAPPVVSPIRVERDHNGVNLATGRMTIEGPVLSVPAAPNLRFDRVQNAAPYFSATITGGGPNPVIGNYNVHSAAAASESFHCEGNFCETVTGTGSVLLLDTAPNRHEYRQAGSGVRYIFNVLHVNDPGPPRKALFYAGSVEYPNGEVITYSYDPGGLSTLPGRTFRRPNRIASNMGYHIQLTYPLQFMDDTNAWFRPSMATLYRSAANMPLRRFSFSGGTVTDSGGTIADPTDDRTYTCSSCGGTLGLDVEIAEGTLQLPGEATPAVQVTPGSSWSDNPLIQTVTRDGVAWTYSYANPHRSDGSLTWLYDSVTVTGPNGFNQVYHMDTIGDPPYGQFNVVDGITAVAESPARPTRRPAMRSMR